MRIEAVVADLDGTLLAHDFSISPATISALNALRKARIPLVLATGRAPLGLRDSDEVTQYAQITVCCSGAIGRTRRRLLWQQHLTAEAVSLVVTTAARYDAGVAGFDGRRWRQTDTYQRLSKSVSDGSQWTGTTLATLRETRCVTMAVLHSGGVLTEVTRALEGGVHTGLSRAADLTILDVTSASVDKGTGVLRALKALGADPAAVVSFGDMPNDIPMFAVTGYACAVGASHPAVAAAADEVLDPVEKDGFASKIAALATAQWRLPG